MLTYCYVDNLAGWVLLFTCGELPSIIKNQSPSMVIFTFFTGMYSLDLKK